MRLKITESKNARSLYIIRSTYENGKHSSKIVEKLGTYSDLAKKLAGTDPIVWAEKYIMELNQKEKEENHEFLIKYFPAKRIKKDEPRTFNGGYLFLQKIYFALGLHTICQRIAQKHKLTFDFDFILSRLLYARILFPASKSVTMDCANSFLESSSFELQHVYTALNTLAKESTYIQSELYKNSLHISKRNTKILYYDCPNYFFETEQEFGLRQYGPSKEHRPNPIVQMGIFMDGNGIPLAFNVSKGNTNKQIPLTSLEKQLLEDFKFSKFVVYTDASLPSSTNWKFNDKKRGSFIMAQSIKKLKKNLQEWALSKNGWRIPGDSYRYDISSLEAAPSIAAALKNRTFYKECWIHADGIAQRLVVTYSLKYRDYQRQIRKTQIEHAIKMADKNPQKINQHNQNDYKRFSTKKSILTDGEFSHKYLYEIDKEQIALDEIFDGFYAICTNLEDDAASIIKINHQRWELEESFRLMETEFKARPASLSREDRILAHFTTCFLTLTLYRFLEKKFDGNFTRNEIIHGLRNMNFYKVIGEGYIPTYTRNDFTDALHEAFQFQTDYQIISLRQMKKIFKDTKS